MELKQGNTYIFEPKGASHARPFKGKVIEITKNTIQIEDLDDDYTARIMRKLFNEEWEATENVTDFSKLVETIKHFTRSTTSEYGRYTYTHVPQILII